MVAAIQPVDASQTPIIRLKATVSVDTAEFTLDQIAELSGGEGKNGAALGQIVMGTSPPPGNYLWIRPASIIQKLRQNGVDPIYYTLMGDNPVKIIREFQYLSKEQVESTLKTFVIQNAPWQKDQMKIRPIAYRQQHKLPRGKIDLRVSTPERTDWLGAETFNVNVAINGDIITRFAVPLFIEVWADVVVAAKTMGRGQPVQREDLSIERMDLSRAPTNAVLDPNQLIGATARHAILEHTTLRINQFEQPPVVRKGDVVTVVAESENLKITTQAVACENGDQGERIELLNLQSKNKIYAQVVDRLTVKVPF